MRTALVLLFLCPVLAAAADDYAVLKSMAGETPPSKLLHAYLLAECQKKFDARKAEVEALKTPADVAARQERLRKQFIDAIGGFPEKTPLKPRTVGTLDRDGYRVEKVIYESRPDHHVTASLYIPAGTGPFPGVLMPIGHSINGKAAEYVQRGSILLAKNGFAVLAYDPIGQGERSQLLDKFGKPAISGSTSEHTMCGIGALLGGRCTASYRIWDGIRSIDYLTSRPEVDAKRIGCTGCSGGGTLTSYLMALDDRVTVAAPSCYITSLERLFATIGPQDGEQNIPGQVAFGLDHADYIFLRAGKPTLLCAATKDFFDIQGTWATFREAKRIYGLLGVPERVDMMESNTAHGYPPSHREAVVRFMNRWLRNVHEPVVEGTFPIEKDADLFCTRTGQVLEDLHGKSVFDLNRDLAAELAKLRGAKPRTAEELRAEVVRALGIAGPSPALPSAVAGVVKRDGYELHQLLMNSPIGIVIPAVLLEPQQTDKTGLPLILVHDGGKAAATGAAEGFVKAGRRVLVVDLRGYGETAAGKPAANKPNYFGVETRESFIAMHLSRPLLGQRVQDLRGVLSHFPGDRGVEVVGYGSAAAVVLHAAVLDDRIKAVTLENGVLSWDLVARTAVSENQFVHVVPGVLKAYDLPDLAAAMAPRPLSVRNPADATGKPAEAPLVEKAYQQTRAAYEKQNAKERFTVTVR